MPPVLVTERLILRPYAETDIETIYRLFEQDPEVYRFDPGFARTLEQRGDVGQTVSRGKRGEGRRHACRDPEGQRPRMIGHVGLQLYVLPWLPFATPEMELYYKLGLAGGDRGTHSRRAGRWRISPSPGCGCSGS